LEIRLMVPPQPPPSDTNRSPLNGSVAMPVAQGTLATVRSTTPVAGLSSCTSPAD
jgi:hypothetical protein